MGIPSFLIGWVIITHCHADHDAGAFQKILESQKVEIGRNNNIVNKN
jgi:glyoxylase-like metal-dependent hydrolase (beta-lactamase superfamily II)